MHLSTLSEWISWIESIHNSKIDLELVRVKAVGARLGVLTSSCPVIIVGGTNGKGSTVAALESIYRAAGYHVGTFTSPYLFKLNEEVRIDGVNASDQDFCAAFEKVEAARANISLTPFEFYTLAALVIFQSHPLDVLILEIGLGGRLDAVNIIDADVAVVTSISIDHVNYLGSTREQIAFEKAGIFRHGKPAVCGDFSPPQTLTGYAASIGAQLFCQGQDFGFEGDERGWSWHFSSLNNASQSETSYQQLPMNSLLVQNMSTVLMAITLLQQRLPVTAEAVIQGLKTVKLTGRIQILPGPVTEIYDVSHNPAAVALLADQLEKMPRGGRTYAVFSMLGDKDIAESIRAIRGWIDTWYTAPLTTPRAASNEQLRQAFQQSDVSDVKFFSSIQYAYEQAASAAREGDRIVVFGSFHTVADVLTYRHHHDSLP